MNFTGLISCDRALRAECVEADLQCGEDYLVHGGEVGFPQHLGPLSQGQDSLISDRSHCGWHLRTKR